VTTVFTRVSVCIDRQSVEGVQHTVVIRGAARPRLNTRRDSSTADGSAPEGSVTALLQRYP
jgi:hypothetical protein